MSGKRDSKREQRRRRQRRKKQQREQAVAMQAIEKVAALALFVEAAGSWRRALSILEEQIGDPEEIEAMRGFVPQTLGGTNDDPDFDEMWRQIVKDGLSSPEGRQTYLQIRDAIAEIERQRGEAA